MVIKPFPNQSMPEGGDKTSNPENLAEFATPRGLRITETIADCINRRISFDQKWKKQMEEANTRCETALKSIQGGSEQRTALLEEMSEKLDRLSDVDRKLDRLNDMSAKLHALDASLGRLDTELRRVVNDGVERVPSPPAERRTTAIVCHPPPPRVDDDFAANPTKIDNEPAAETFQPARSVSSSRSAPNRDKENGPRWPGPEPVDVFNQRRREANIKSVRRQKLEAQLLPLHDVSARYPKQLPKFPPTARAFLELDREDVSCLLKGLRPDAETRPEWGQADRMRAALAELVGGMPLHDLWLEHHSNKTASKPAVACGSSAQAQKDRASGGFLSFFDAPVEIGFTELVAWSLFVLMTYYYLAMLGAFHW